MTDQPNFKPSDVNLCDSFPPLVGTMGRTEAEIAAALLVRACQMRGDVWQDVSIGAIFNAFSADLQADREPFHSMKGNPFCRPDFHDLAKRGCAFWIGEPGEPGSLLRFTAKGFDGLRKVVARSPVQAADATVPA